MRAIILFASIALFTFASARKFAFVSVLTSNSYLLTAKVLAHRLKTLHKDIPYIVIVTEDITDASRASLRKQGVPVVQFPKLDTPYLSTHKARKYQYTKIRLWGMEEYEMVTHLDLDLLPVNDISTLFYCGTFCASLRYAEMLNSGVYVLKTNKTVIDDMLQKVPQMYSYDGGDQGFLNSYFPNLKFAPMFDETNTTYQPYESKERRLSSAFNFDIGLYYISGERALVKPKIIHYTLGPMKPWLWWSYPLFDINYFWLEARYDMESTYNESNPDLVLIPYQLAIDAILVLLFKVLVIAGGKRLQNDQVKQCEKTVVLHSAVILSLYLACNSVPPEPHPVPAWIYFVCNWVATSFALTSAYSHLRLGSEPSGTRIAVAAAVLLASLAASWIVVANVGIFSSRLFTVFVVAIYNELLAVLVLRRFVLAQDTEFIRYEVLPTKAC